MNIGFDAKRLFFNNSGLGNYSRNLVSQLNHHFPEHRYYLFTHKKPNTPQFSEINQFCRHPFKIITPNVLHKPFWRTSRSTFDIKKHHLDIYHGLSHELPFNIHANKSVKKIVTIHDLIFERFPEYYSSIDRKIYRWKWKYACQVADKIIAISEQTKRDLIQLYDIPKSQIEVIYQGCDPIFFSAKGSDSVEDISKKYQLPEQFFLYVGSIIPRKNLLNIIRAMQEIRLGKRIPLIVVGRGKAYADKVIRYCRQNKLAGAVRILDVQDTTELKILYQLAVALVYPSSFEGFGIPIIESLACHTPVITSKFSALPEAAGPGGILIDPQNIGELKDAMESLQSNLHLRASFAEKGHQYVLKHFSNQKMAAETMRIYES